MNYYTEKHVPLAGNLIGDAVKGVAMAKGLGGPENSPAAYTMIADMYFDSVESFENSFGPVADKILADIPNFTNVQPTILISEVLA